MSKLSEILAAKRLANQQAKTGGQNATSALQKPVENSAPIAKEAGEKLPPVRSEPAGNSASGEQTPSATISTNGSNGGQEKPPVLLTGLKAKLAERLTQNANVSNGTAEKIVPNKTSPSQNKTVTEPAPKISQQNAKVDDATLHDRHSNVGSSTGTIDPTELRKNLNFLAANIEQQELVRQVVATIAIQLRGNPALKEYMKDADVDLVVRGLRRSYNVAKFAKAQKAETKNKKKAVDLELDKMLGDLGIDLKL